VSEKRYPVCKQSEPSLLDRPGETLLEPDAGMGNAALADMLPTASSQFDHPIPHEDSLAGVNVQYGLQSSPAGLGVHVPIHAHESDVDDATLQRMYDGIDATWNNQFEVCRNGECAPVQFAPEFRRERQGNENIIGDAGAGPTNVRYWQTEDEHPIAPEDRLNDRGSVELAAGHEFGHLLGIPDEYGRSPANFEAVTGRPPTVDEIQRNGTVKAADNGMGTTGEPMLPRHLQHMADWVEAQDPEGGTVTIRARPDAECQPFDG
jgi:hypothetical protein